MRGITCFILSLSVGICVGGDSVAGVNHCGREDVLDEETLAIQYKDKLGNLVDEAKESFFKKIDQREKSDPRENSFDRWERAGYMQIDQYAEQARDELACALMFFLMKDYAEHNDKGRAERLSKRIQGQLEITCDEFMFYVLKKALLFDDEAFGDGSGDEQTRLEYIEGRMSVADLAEEGDKETKQDIYQDLVKRYENVSDDRIALRISSLSANLSLMFLKQGDLSRARVYHQKSGLSLERVQDKTSDRYVARVRIWLGLQFQIRYAESVAAFLNGENRESIVLLEQAFSSYERYQAFEAPAKNKPDDDAVLEQFESLVLLSLVQRYFSCEMYDEASRTISTMKDKYEKSPRQDERLRLLQARIYGLHDLLRKGFQDEARQQAVLIIRQCDEEEKMIEGWNLLQRIMLESIREEVGKSLK